MFYSEFLFGICPNSAKCSVSSLEVPTYGWMDGWMDDRMDGWMDRWMMDGWMDGWMDRWMDGWMDGQMDDGWMDGRMEISVRRVSSLIIKQFKI